MTVSDPLVKVIRLHEDVKIPAVQCEGDSGFDLHVYLTGEPMAPLTFRIKPHETVLVKTGLKMEIPKGFEGQIRSRSGMASKGIIVANQPGTIDSGYRGEIGILLHNLTDRIQFVTHQDRVAQMVICPIATPVLYEVREISETERGEGGFGHSGQ